MLFPPSTVDEIAQHPPRIDSSTLRPYNPAVGTNAEQWCAVRHIVEGVMRGVPYVLFGPPGTGKTTTAVEACTQIYRALPQMRMLLVASTNTAADLLCAKLALPVRERSPHATAPGRVTST